MSVSSLTRKITELTEANKLLQLENLRAQRELETAKKVADRYKDMLPDNICYDACQICEAIWYQNQGPMTRCQCQELRVCLDCAETMKRPVSLEHNMVNCLYDSSEEEEKEELC